MGEFIITRFGSDVKDDEILEKYAVGKMISVVITKDGKYKIREPPLTEQAKRLHNTLMTTIRNSFDTKNISTSMIFSSLKDILEDEARKINQLDLYLSEKASLEYYLKRNFNGYGVLDPLINDNRLEDILATLWDAPITVKHRDYPFFHNMQTNVQFTSKQMMLRWVNRFSSKYGQPPSDASPESSFSNENNVRFTVTGNDIITPNGPTISIRIPSKIPITIYHLLKNDILTPLAAAYLWMIIDLKGFTLVIGATSAGKTTLINAIFSMTNPNWHYYTIEDVLELSLNHRIVSTHKVAENSTLKIKNKETDHTVFSLLKLALRFKPEFILVGEVLGNEAEGLFQVAQSGMGCYSSFHATSPYDALAKLQSDKFGVSREQTRAITCIIHMSQVTRGNTMRRAILEIVEPEIVAVENFKKKLNTIFYYDSATGKLKPDSIDKLLEKSSKLNDASSVLGITNIREDFQKRIDVLEKIQNNNLSTSGEISRESDLYYQSLLSSSD